ncbi:MAG: glycoside hydrolase family 2, partial [Rikenellaceae bacterium]|nr:glycoside hydrolase family 2 [Rikenellaceae bacterium]
MKRFSIISVLLLLIAGQTEAQPRLVDDLSGEGWKLWHDTQAQWQQEEIFNQPVDISELPVVSPTGGWTVLGSAQMVGVKVPGTLEEYLQKESGPEGDLSGVSWWVRPLDIPKYTGVKKVILKFGSIRSRAEVFIDRKLAGYWIVDNVPFEVDITKFVQPGRTAELAVRITDAGGNYDWRDGALIPWGDKTLPPGHAFGGITGRVILEVCDPVYTSDIYMQNTPALTTVNAVLTINNTTGKAVTRSVTVDVYPAGKTSPAVFSAKLTQTFAPGENEIIVPVSVPDAGLWDVDNPNLYSCAVLIQEGSRAADLAQQRFGFRWFEAEGIGQDAIFRLNGKRIVLRSSISWSFWPVNGIFPTDELARRQIEIAKELGLNMLNFHRFMGSPNVLDYADELGLLYFEEPGGYRTQANNPFLRENLRQKVMMMVKRDRSHPSLVIFNMMNESGAARPDKLAVELSDMRQAHALDPSRYLLRTSAWAAADYVDDQAKIHLRPYDTTMYWNGWYDYHHAGGPASWHQELYRGPGDYYNNTTNKKEIVFYGEEG